MANNNFTRDQASLVFIRELKRIKEGVKEEVPEGEDEKFAKTIYPLPTVNAVTRVLVMGVLIEKEDIGTTDAYMKGRITDSSGSINVFAGTYQPEAAQQLMDLETPCHVAVVGKPKIFVPDDGSVNVSITAESITPVTRDQIDIWTQQTSRATLARLKEMEDGDEKEAYYTMVREALNSLDA